MATSFTSAATTVTLTTATGAITSLTTGRLGHATVHEIIGRADPIVVGAGLRLRTGHLSVQCLTLATALAIVARCAAGVVTVVASEHPGLTGIKIAATATQVTPAQRTAAGWQWLVDVDWVEVA